MVILGVDAHKRSHTVVAVDEGGKQLGSLTFDATESGHFKALAWASKWTERRWAIEDVRPLSKHLERDLLVGGESCLRVPPHMTAQHRRPVRQAGKSDPIDAYAIGLACLREPDLPVATLAGIEREVRLLVDHREDLIKERTARINRLHLLIHSLDPNTSINRDTFRSQKAMNKLSRFIDKHSGLEARIAAELMASIVEGFNRIKGLEAELKTLVEKMCPNLLAINGIGIIGAAKFLAEIGDVRRFKSKDAFAVHNGTAPIPAWSGNTTHYRLNPGGNRSLNSVIYVASLCQERYFEPAQKFVERRNEEGKPKSNTRRALKRHISDAIFRAMIKDAQLRDQPADFEPVLRAA